MLEVKSGPSLGKGLRLLPGQSMRIGRTSKSDFAILTDSHLSGIHFEVSVTENEGRLRDLKSTNGTLLNGQRIVETILHDGDTITAGETVFRVTIATTELPTAAATPQPTPEDTPQQRLLSLFRNQYQPLYAILDAARDVRILALLMQSKEQYQSLYEGVEGDKLAQVAPYLVRLEKDSLLLSSLILEGWGNSWGVFLSCADDLQAVRRYLRHFLEVQLPDGKQVYFRFYDPRVLRVFLPTCTADETNQFFGPVKHYLMEDEQPDNLLQFANTGHGVDRRPISLTPPEPAATDKKAATTKTVKRTVPMPEKAIPKPEGE
jgi:hypothetical protein